MLPLSMDEHLSWIFNLSLQTAHINTLTWIAVHTGKLLYSLENAKGVNARYSNNIGRSNRLDENKSGIFKVVAEDIELVLSQLLSLEDLFMNLYRMGLSLLVETVGSVCKEQKAAKLPIVCRVAVGVRR